MWVGCDCAIQVSEVWMHGFSVQYSYSKTSSLALLGRAAGISCCHCLRWYSCRWPLLHSPHTHRCTLGTHHVYSGTAKLLNTSGWIILSIIERYSSLRRQKCIATIGSCIGRCRGVLYHRFHCIRLGVCVCVCAHIKIASVRHFVFGKHTGRT